MPLIKSKKVKSGIIGFWKIADDDDFLFGESIFQSYHPKWRSYKSDQRKKQVLATRLLLNKISKEKELNHNQHGKPFLGSAKNHISISHDNNIVVIYISKDRCGVDIQSKKRSVLKIFNRYYNPLDFANLKKESELFMLWCAKESLYKIYGDPRVSFKKHLIVQQGKQKKTLEGECSLSPFEFKCIINLITIENYLLVYTSEFKKPIS